MAAVAGDTAEGLRAYRDRRPDFVVLDAAFDADDGLRTLTALRRLDKRAQVLLVSGDARRPAEKEALAAGACGVLVEPYGRQDLLDAVLRAIAARPDAAGLALARPQRRTLLRIIARGARDGAERLSALAGAPWKAEAAALDDAAGGPRRNAEFDYGAYFFMPGAAFLALLAPKSVPALLRTARPDGGQARPKLIDGRHKAAARIAGVVVGAVAAALAAACKMACFLSPPRLMAGSRAALSAEARRRFALQAPRYLAAGAQLRASATASDCAVVVLLDPGFVRTIRPALRRS